MNMSRLMCLCAAVAAFLAIPVVTAAPAGTAATVPFEFVAGGRLMPAGVYFISQPNPAGIMQITSDTRGSSALLMSYRVGPGPAALQPRLVFEKVGGKYHLKQVWSSPDHSGVQVGGR